MKIKIKKTLNKEVLSLWISIFAILISIFSFYYNDIRIEDNLQARVVRASHGLVKKDSIYRPAIMISIAYINSGNRQSIIFSPRYRIMDYLKPTNHITGLQGGFYNDCDFPIVLQPKEMKIVNLKFYAESLFSYLNSPTTKSSKQIKKECFLSVKYSALNSSGEFLEKQSEYLVKILTTYDQINFILPANPDEDFTYNKYKPTLISD